MSPRGTAAGKLFLVEVPESPTAPHRTPDAASGAYWGRDGNRQRILRTAELVVLLRGREDRARRFQEHRRERVLVARSGDGVPAVGMQGLLFRISPERPLDIDPHAQRYRDRLRPPIVVDSGYSYPSCPDGRLAVSAPSAGYALLTHDGEVEVAVPLRVLDGSGGQTTVALGQALSPIVEGLESWTQLLADDRDAQATVALDVWGLLGHRAQLPSGSAFDFLPMQRHFVRDTFESLPESAAVGALPAVRFALRRIVGRLWQAAGWADGCPYLDERGEWVRGR